MENLEFSAAVVSVAFLCLECLYLLDRVNKGLPVTPRRLTIFFVAIAVEAIGCLFAN